MKQLTAGLALGLLSTAVAAEVPSNAEMWKIIQQQQAEITELKKQIANTDEEVKQTSEQVEATATIVEESLASGGGSLASSWVERTHVGGYGEMHYNNLEDQNSDAGSDKDRDEIDFHRYVFFLGHDFNDKTRFFSEVELEHSLAGDGKPGEVELEQAYIEHDLSGSTRARVGQFLLPVGILNETHEPNTFFGVERNNVEKNIIPTTWWEGGVALNGELMPGLNYDAAFTSGLKIDADAGKYKIRDGRQKVAKADASDPAYTLALSYTGVAGLEIGAALNYQEDLYQGGLSDQVDALLYTAHVAYENGPFGLRALAASWDIDSAIEQIKLGASAQEGWYIEPSFMATRDLGLFARYSEWDNQADGGGDTEYAEWTLGLNYWLHENVALKFDYLIQDSPDGATELEGFNLGVGWSFQ